MGKVMSRVFTLSLCAQPLGQVVYGFLFDQFSQAVYWVLLPSGLALWAVGMGARHFFKSLEKIIKKEALPQGKGFWRIYSFLYAFMRFRALLRMR